MKHPSNTRILSLAALCVAAAACSGSGSSTTGSANTSGGTFLVLKTEPLNNGRLFLNDPIRVDFTNQVDLGTANLNTFNFQVLDQNGNALAEQPVGHFAIDTTPGDAAAGRRLLFVPKFPSNNTYDDGGFRPGRTYLVQLVGGDRHNGTVLRDQGGKGLASPVTFRFNTADGTTPAQLFRDTKQGGPQKVDFQVSPSASLQSVGLNKFGAPPVELRLVFNQPLNPHSANVPVALDTNPLLRSVNDRGRVYLEYDDPDPAIGRNRWIPADVELEVNDLTRAVVVLRPVGVLPNNADIRVIVQNTLEDISGESNVANAAYNPVFATFHTSESYEPQFDAVVESFDSDAQVDYTAPFLEPMAEVNQGFLKAGFDFEGSQTTLEFEPNVAEVVLNTDFTQVVPRNGTPFNVAGGVFNFRNVNIPAGVRVKGLGSNPMVWLCSGNFRVAGELNVRGGDGDRVNTLNSANYPSAGGVGVCGGGNGGRGSPNGTSRDMAGEAGFGPRQRPGGGGRGGRISCAAGCGRGSGGGGGSMATQGDPNYKAAAGTGTGFQQRRGVGGQGCNGGSGTATRSLAGGEAGPLLFTDARTDNNFWGSAVNVNRQLRITGEFAAPQGGEGGGGGGDLSNSGGCSTTDPNFANDSKGGGGGGGGGVLIVKALGNIEIATTGRITADGGHGGGGEQAGSCNEGGGGGAGAGGMVILMAGGQIIINAHGVASANRYTYAANDYDFAISADGGVTLTGTFGSPVVSQKYAASGQTVMAGTTYDSAPLGGFGGMGVVQLMAPPGDPNSPTANADNTNTYLDDNIVVIRDGQTLTGTNKTAMLAWRGFPNALGTMVDDFGNATNIGDNEGDIRPAPLFLPVTFSTKTRMRSKWIDTGSSSRRALTANDGQARGVVEDTVNGFLAGPTYDFAGTANNPGGLNHGYVAYTQSGGEAVSINYPALWTSPAVVRGVDANATFQGRGCYGITVDAGTMGQVVDRYTQYEAELLTPQATVLGSYRILSHTDRNLLISSESGALPLDTSNLRLQVRAKFFKIVTNSSEGLGPTYAGFVANTAVPTANVRIGFAFHQDPASATATRYPSNPNQFVFNLADPVVQETIRNNHMGYVMWDVVFDTAFKSVAGDVPPALSPSLARPELHFLRLPYRF